MLSVYFGARSVICDGWAHGRELIAMEYFNTLIGVSPDTKATAGTVLPARVAPKSVATLEYELIAGAPCTHTHEDVQFAVHLARTRASTLLGADAPSISRAEFFSKSHACMRASALPKTYGWGLHFDDHGRVALVGVETDRYRQLASDPSLTHMPAMRSKRA